MPSEWYGTDAAIASTRGNWVVSLGAIPDAVTWPGNVGIPLNTPAWDVADITGVFDSAPTRGKDLQIPYAHGVTPRQRWRDALPISIEMNIFGEYDPIGTRHVDPVGGVRLNMRTFIGMGYSVFGGDYWGVERVLRIYSTVAGYPVQGWGNDYGLDISCHVTYQSVRCALTGPTSAVAQLSLLCPSGEVTHQTSGTSLPTYETPPRPAIKSPYFPSNPA